MKKYLLGILTVLALILVGCTKGEDSVHAEIFKDIQITFKENTNKLDYVTDDIYLPSTSEKYVDAVIEWESSNEEIIHIEDGVGVVTRVSQNVVVTLTATITYNEESKDFDVNLTVIKLDETVEPEPTEVDFEAIFAQITLPELTTQSINLPTEIDGAFLSWVSSNPDVLNNSGDVYRSDRDEIVELTVTATKDSQEDSKIFTIKVLKEVKAPTSTKTPVEEIREKTLGSTVTVHGVVTSLMSNGNYTIQDSTGAIAVFMNNNTILEIGREYIISGPLGDFNGLIQIGTSNTKPTIVEAKDKLELPEAVDLTGYSLDYDDVILYESYVVNYNNLEVIGTATPNNAYELTVKNSAGEETLLRLDTRVNTTNARNKLSEIKVGEIIDLSNVSVSQYKNKAQFLFTSRSEVTSRPKDPNIPVISGTKNFVVVIGDAKPNYLEGVTAKNANNVDFTNKLVVDDSKVDLTKYGNYEVVIKLVGVTGYENISVTIQVYVRNEISTGVFEGYYQSLSGLVGDEFNRELERLIQKTGKATGTTEEVKKVDNFNGQNYNIYSGFGAYGNREHVWPNSKLGTAPKYDLHNLRAAVVKINGDRGNMPFARGKGSYGVVSGGWYPGDEHIGDVARIVLYISIRYKLNINLVGNLDMFLEWHQLDPVSPFEISRNDKIFGEQKNRNPFIDHPELVSMYYGK